VQFLRSQYRTVPHETRALSYRSSSRRWNELFAPAYMHVHTVRKETKNNGAVLHRQRTRPSPRIGCQMASFRAGTPKQSVHPSLGDAYRVHPTSCAAHTHCRPFDSDGAPLQGRRLSGTTTTMQSLDAVCCPTGMEEVHGLAHGQHLSPGPCHVCGLANALLRGIRSIRKVVLLFCAGIARGAWQRRERNVHCLPTGETS
jgi:hypothetical protein